MQSAIERLFGFWDNFIGRAQTEDIQNQKRVGESGVRGGKPAVEGDCLFVKFDGFG